MPHRPPIRTAQGSDLDALVELEKRCFTTDRLSRRSLRHFLSAGQHQLLVCGEPVQAYILLLFRRGTSLVRIYSLAVDPAWRGRGMARQLMEAAEQRAHEHQALFLRLEVAANNHPARALYSALGYHSIDTLPAYYEDGGDGLRLEKRLVRHLTQSPRLPFYAQTTEFTCGPAAALMAMEHLQPERQFSQIDEINLWREATTVFMTQGHGGCSPQGLALALSNRGFKVELLQSSDCIPFIDSVRREDKKQLIAAVHHYFVEQLAHTFTRVETTALTTERLRQALQQGYRTLLLISTYQLNRNKAPHWVWLVAMDDNFAYINDPDCDPDDRRSAIDNTYLPIRLTMLDKLLGYGKRGYRAAINFGNK